MCLIKDEDEYKEQRRKTVDKLKRELVKSLNYNFSDHEDALRKQMRALDYAFRELMGQNFVDYGDNVKLRAALQAQNQFRATMNTLTFSKLLEKKTPTPRKNGERTEQKNLSQDSILAKGEAYLGREGLRRAVDEAIDRKLTALELEAETLQTTRDDDQTSSLRATNGSEAIQKEDKNWIASSAQEKDAPPRNDGEET